MKLNSHLRSQRASALVVAIFFVVVLSIFIGLALNPTTSTARTDQRNANMIAATAIAEGAVEAASRNGNPTWCLRAEHKSPEFRT